MNSSIIKNSKIIALSAINPQFITALFDTAGNHFVFNIFMTFLMALLQSVVIYILISMHNGQSRGSLLWKVTLIFYGTTYLQANIEATLFLNYFQNTMGDDQIYEMLLTSIMSSIILVPAGTFLFWRKKDAIPVIAFPLKTNLLRGAGLSILYLIIYVLFGALVFMPLAGEHFESYYGQAQIPRWFFPYQVLRGALWTLLAWGSMTVIAGTRKQVVWAITAVIAVPMTSLLLPVNEVMPTPIRIPHFIETGSSMLLFGFLAGWILTRGRRKE